jgi:transposase-like protein
LGFETATLERYRRREATVEETLVEMYFGKGIGGEWKTLLKT